MKIKLLKDQSYYAWPVNTVQLWFSMTCERDIEFEEDEITTTPNRDGTARYRYMYKEPYPELDGEKIKAITWWVVS